MKKILTILLICLAATACKNKTESSNTVNNNEVKDTTQTTIAVVPDTNTTKAVVTQTENEPEIKYKDSINFAKFPVYESSADSVMIDINTGVAPIKWNSYPEAKTFKTRIIEAYKNPEVSFAGHYVLSVFGCGAGCLMGFMIDTRNGYIYDLPLGEENSCYLSQDRLLCDITSSLFISSVCKENQTDKKVSYIAYLWDEDKKEFKSIKAAKFLIKKL